MAPDGCGQWGAAALEEWRPYASGPRSDSLSMSFPEGLWWKSVLAKPTREPANVERLASEITPRRLLEIDERGDKRLGGHAIDFLLVEHVPAVGEELDPEARIALGALLVDLHGCLAGERRPASARSVRYRDERLPDVGGTVD